MVDKVGRVLNEFIKAPKKQEKALDNSRAVLHDIDNNNNDSGGNWLWNFVKNNPVSVAATGAGILGAAAMLMRYLRPRAGNAAVALGAGGGVIQRAPAPNVLPPALPLPPSPRAAPNNFPPDQPFGGGHGSALTPVMSVIVEPLAHVPAPVVLPAVAVVPPAVEPVDLPAPAADALAPEEVAAVPVAEVGPPTLEPIAQGSEIGSDAHVAPPVADLADGLAATAEPDVEAAAGDSDAPVAGPAEGDGDVVEAAVPELVVVPAPAPEEVAANVPVVEVVPPALELVAEAPEAGLDAAAEPDAEAAAVEAAVPELVVVPAPTPEAVAAHAAEVASPAPEPADAQAAEGVPAPEAVAALEPVAEAPETGPAAAAEPDVEAVVVIPEVVAGDPGAPVADPADGPGDAVEVAVPEPVAAAVDAPVVEAPVAAPVAEVVHHVPQPVDAPAHVAEVAPSAPEPVAEAPEASPAAAAEPDVEAVASDPDAPVADPADSPAAAADRVALPDSEAEDEAVIPAATISPDAPAAEASFTANPSPVIVSDIAVPVPVAPEADASFSHVHDAISAARAAREAEISASYDAVHAAIDSLATSAPATNTPADVMDEVVLEAAPAPYAPHADAEGNASPAASDSEEEVEESEGGSSAHASGNAVAYGTSSPAPASPISVDAAPVAAPVLSIVAAIANYAAALDAFNAAHAAGDDTSEAFVKLNNAYANIVDLTGSFSAASLAIAAAGHDLVGDARTRSSAGFTDSAGHAEVAPLTMSLDDAVSNYMAVLAAARYRVSPENESLSWHQIKDKIDSGNATENETRAWEDIVEAYQAVIAAANGNREVADAAIHEAFADTSDVTSPLNSSMARGRSASQAPVDDAAAGDEYAEHSAEARPEEEVEGTERDADGAHAPAADAAARDEDGEHSPEARPEEEVEGTERDADGAHAPAADAAARDEDGEHSPEARAEEDEENADPNAERDASHAAASVPGNYEEEVERTEGEAAADPDAAGADDLVSDAPNAPVAGCGDAAPDAVEDAAGAPGAEASEAAGEPDSAPEAAPPAPEPVANNTACDGAEDAPADADVLLTDEAEGANHGAAEPSSAPASPAHVPAAIEEEVVAPTPTPSVVLDADGHGAEAAPADADVPLAHEAEGANHDAVEPNSAPASPAPVLAADGQAPVANAAARDEDGEHSAEARAEEDEENADRDAERDSSPAAAPMSGNVEEVEGDAADGQAPVADAAARDEDGEHSAEARVEEEVEGTERDADGAYAPAADVAARDKDGEHSAEARAEEGEENANCDAERDSSPAAPMSGNSEEVEDATQASSVANAEVDHDVPPAAEHENDEEDEDGSYTKGAVNAGNETDNSREVDHLDGVAALFSETSPTVPAADVAAEPEDEELEDCDGSHAEEGDGEETKPVIPVAAVNNIEEEAGVAISYPDAEGDGLSVAASESEKDEEVEETEENEEATEDSSIEGADDVAEEVQVVTSVEEAEEAPTGSDIHEEDQETSLAHLGAIGEVVEAFDDHKEEVPPVAPAEGATSEKDDGPVSPIHTEEDTAEEAGGHNASLVVEEGESISPNPNPEPASGSPSVADLVSAYIDALRAAADITGMDHEADIVNMLKQKVDSGEATEEEGASLEDLTNAFKAIVKVTGSDETACDAIDAARLSAHMQGPNSDLDEVVPSPAGDPVDESIDPALSGLHEAITGHDGEAVTAAPADVSTTDALAAQVVDALNTYASTPIDDSSGRVAALVAFCEAVGNDSVAADIFAEYFSPEHDAVRAVAVGGAVAAAYSEHGSASASNASPVLSEAHMHASEEPAAAPGPQAEERGEPTPVSGVASAIVNPPITEDIGGAHVSHELSPAASGFCPASSDSSAAPAAASTESIALGTSSASTSPANAGASGDPMPSAQEAPVAPSSPSSVSAGSAAANYVAALADVGTTAGDAAALANIESAYGAVVDITGNTKAADALALPASPQPVVALADPSISVNVVNPTPVSTTVATARPYSAALAAAEARRKADREAEADHKAKILAIRSAAADAAVADARHISDERDAANALRSIRAREGSILKAARDYRIAQEKARDAHQLEAHKQDMYFRAQEAAKAAYTKAEMMSEAHSKAARLEVGAFSTAPHQRALPAAPAHVTYAQSLAAKIAVERAAHLSFKDDAAKRISSIMFKVDHAKAVAEAKALKAHEEQLAVASEKSKVAAHCAEIEAAKALAVLEVVSAKPGLTIEAPKAPAPAAAITDGKHVEVGNTHHLDNATAPVLSITEYAAVDEVLSANDQVEHTDAMALAGVSANWA